MARENPHVTHEIGSQGSSHCLCLDYDDTFGNHVEILASALMRKRREERQNSPMHLPLAMKMMMTRESRLDFRS